MLLRLVLVICLIQVIILAIWTGVDRLRPIERAHPDDDTIDHTVCSSDNAGTIILGILLTYDVCLLLWGAFLAWKTRKVTLVYNESKSLMVAIYNFLAAFFILIPVFLALQSDPFIRFILVSITFLLVCTAALIALFVPKFRLMNKSDLIERTRKNMSTRKQSKAYNSKISATLTSATNQDGKEERRSRFFLLFILSFFKLRCSKIWLVISDTLMNN